jgi:hypothetical protein
MIRSSESVEDSAIIERRTGESISLAARRDSGAIYVGHDPVL